MSSTVDQPNQSDASGPLPPADSSAPVARVNRKSAVIFAVLTCGLAAIVGFEGQSGTTTFRLATPSDFAQLPEIQVPSTPTTWVMVVLCALMTAGAFALYARGRRTPLWLVIGFSVAWMSGFLTWAAAGATIPVVGLLGGAIALAVPLVFGALGGVLGERAGVVNIAIDGQLLAGAFAAALVGSLTGVTWAGLAGAMLAGALVALILGLFAISYYVEQVIVGVVLNVLVIGVTSFLFTQVLSSDTAKFNSPPHFSRLAIPVLSDLPLVGPIFFQQTAIVYLLYIAVPLVTWALFRTTWGLRVRAVGEHPRAADTVGIKVNRTRYRTVLIAGAVAGAGGAFYTLVAVPQFNREMTGGAGYIALAAVIFGKWDPIRATLAALLFGFASNLQGVLSVIGSPVPSQFMLMLPYVVTIFAVAGLVGRSRPPAADGIPYRKG